MLDIQKEYPVSGIPSCVVDLEFYNNYYLTKLTLRL